MTTVLVTGANGFIGRNLVEALHQISGVQTLGIDITDEPEALTAGLGVADVVYHLAGVNRPKHEDEFVSGNVGLTSTIVGELLGRDTKPVLVYSSTIQAELDNPYGRSKRLAESAVEGYGKNGGRAIIFRLPNVFGKWSRPNYNSAVATFCHNIARGLEISVSNPEHHVELVYVDDVVKAFMALLHEQDVSAVRRLSVTPVTRISLANLVAELHAIHNIRTTLNIPDMSDYFRKCLYATYLSFLPADKFDYELLTRVDQRGALAELLKSRQFGQIFVSRTKPGIERGNHYHNTKVEKFCVVEGEAVIRFRQILGKDVQTYHVNGDEFRVVDIPPGYTHSIENVGNRDMVVLFWASEPFDPAAPDTYANPVRAL